MMILHKALMVIGLSSICLCQTVPKWNLACETRENVTRAVGTNFSVTIVSHCNNNPIDCYMKYIFEASDNDQDFKQVLVNEDGSNGDRAEKSLKNGVMFHYEFRKLDEQNSIIFNLTVVSSNQSHAVNLKIQKYDGCTAAFTFATINFEGCKNDSASNIVSSSELVGYLEYGNIVCNNGVEGKAVFSNGSEATRTQCDADAKWKDAGNIECLYPIDAKLTIDDQPFNKTVELKYNHSNPNHGVLLNCTSSDPKVMNNVSIFLVGNRKMDNRSLIISPNLNGANVSCYIKNNYTKRFNESLLSTSTLDIKFGPYPPRGYSTLCSASNGSVLFYSNPVATEKSLMMVSRGNNSNGTEQDQEIPSTIEYSCKISYGVQGQVITPNSTNKTNLYLRTNSSGHFVYYPVVSCSSFIPTTTDIETQTSHMVTSGRTTVHGKGTSSPMVATVKTTVDVETQTSSMVKLTTGVNIVIPIASAAAGLMVVIFGAFFCWKRYHKGKSESSDTDKVENANPLYGTVEILGADVTSKEEVANPLYGTAQSFDGVAEVYSTVDKKKIERGKKKSKAPKSTTDVYAVVEKRKENSESQGHSTSNELCASDATYSVVNKKQKKIAGAQDLNQPSTSGMETYAAVDRSKKKAHNGKGKTNPGMIVESQSTYAQVDRTAKKNKIKPP